MSEHQISMERGDSFDSLTLVTPPALNHGPAHDISDPTPPQGMRAALFKCQALHYGLAEKMGSSVFNAEVVNSSMTVGSEHKSEEDEHEIIRTLYIPFVQRVICQGTQVGLIEVDALITVGFPMGGRKQTMCKMAESVDACVLTDTHLTTICQWRGDHTIRQVTRKEIDWEIKEGIEVPVALYMRRWAPGCWTMFNLAFEHQVRIEEEVVQSMDEVTDSPDLDNGSWARDTITCRQGNGSEVGSSSVF